MSAPPANNQSLPQITIHHNLFDQYRPGGQGQSLAHNLNKYQIDQFHDRSRHLATHLCSEFFPKSDLAPNPMSLAPTFPNSLVISQSPKANPMCVSTLQNGSIQIWLNYSNGPTFWQMFMYQFAHEFLHATTHFGLNTNRNVEYNHPHHWLEEAFAEAASRFALLRARRLGNLRNKPERNFPLHNYDTPYHETVLANLGTLAPKGKPLSEWLLEPTQRTANLGTIRTNLDFMQAYAQASVPANPLPPGWTVETHGARPENGVVAGRLLEVVTKY